MNYYTEVEVKSCPQHIEAKLLANKLWLKYSSINDKLAEEATKKTPNILRIQNLVVRDDEILKEFSNVRRGLMRCCTVC